MSALILLSLNQVVCSIVAFNFLGGQIGFALLLFSLQSLDSNGLHVFLLLQLLRFKVKLGFLIVSLLLVLLSLRNSGIELVQSRLLTSDRLLRLFQLPQQSDFLRVLSHEFLVLLFLFLHEFFPFLVTSAQNSLLLELLLFVSPALSFSNLLLILLYLSHPILLFFFSARCFLLFFIYALLKIGNPVDLLHGHTDGATHALSFLPNLIDLQLALFQGLLLLGVGALEHLILRIILLFKGAQVLVADDFVQELLELSLDLLEGVRVEAELIYLLNFLGFVSNEANVEL